MNAIASLWMLCAGLNKTDDQIDSDDDLDPGRKSGFFIV